MIVSRGPTALPIAGSLDWSSFTDIWTHVPPALWTLFLASLGVGALTVLYSRIDTVWPESYASVSSTVERQLRSGFLRHYIIFRGAPVFLVALFSTIMIERAGGYPWLGISALVSWHLALTNLRAIWRILRAPSNYRNAFLLVHHVGVSAVVAVASFIATSARGRLSPLVPSMNDLMIAMWAGLLASLFLATAHYYMSPQEIPIGVRVADLERDVGRKHWEAIPEVAELHRSDPLVLQAVILAEVEQRPRWFRAMERLAGRFRRGGTYGVAQVWAPKPIGDRKSIEELAKRFGGYEVPHDPQGWPDLGNLHARLLGHNPDPEHADRIVELFDHLAPESAGR